MGWDLALCRRGEPELMENEHKSNYLERARYDQAGAASCQLPTNPRLPLPQKYLPDEAFSLYSHHPSVTPSSLHPHSFLPQIELWLLAFLHMLHLPAQPLIALPPERSLAILLGHFLSGTALCFAMSVCFQHPLTVPAVVR